MLDLSKAFDSVDHCILLWKLQHYGVREEELKWFAGYLDGRRQRVVVGDVKSEWSDVKRGVPQGSILGSLLFILYVNDLPNIIQHCRDADDTTLSCVGSDAAELGEGLTEDLKRVARWVEINKLSLSVMKKTKLLLTSRKRRAQELEHVQVKVDDRNL